MWKQLQDILLLKTIIINSRVIEVAQAALKTWNTKRILIFAECAIKNNYKEGLSWYERREDALALGADEGRDKLRKAAGIGKYELYPRVSEWRNPAE